MKLSRKFLLYVLLPVLVMGGFMLLGYRATFRRQLNRFVQGRPEVRMFYALHPYISSKKLKRFERAKREITEKVMLYFVLSLGISLSVAMLLAEIFQRKVSALLKEVSTAAEKMAEGKEVKIKNKTFSTEFEDLISSVERLSTKLREKSEARRKMTSSVYHEIMTPLSAVKMQLEALRDGMIEYDSKMPTNMIGSLEHVISVLKDLKNVEGGELKYTRTIFNASRVCRELCDTFQSIFESRKIDFSCTINEANLLADEQRFRQVVFNLLSNAAKYTAMDGKVLLTVKDNLLEISNTFYGNTKIEFGDGLNFVKDFCEFYGWRFLIVQHENIIKVKLEFKT